MINKKNVLGKPPEELGDKDAIHVAIVSVRAAKAIQPGQRCSLNADREAIPNDDKKTYVGVADPFRNRPILRGESFWLVLKQDAVDNVQHTWEHPEVDFTAPTVEVKKNKVIQATAESYKVSYEDAMAAAAYVAEHNKPARYHGTLESLESVTDDFDRYDFWSSWARESLHEFYNEGSDCCPEYDYPTCDLFAIKE
jgi:hypothetical protein